MSAAEQPVDSKPLNLGDFRTMRANGEAIACLTAYDAAFAAAQEAAGVDLILVGDSLGMVIQGHRSTVPVTVGDILYHTRCVTRSVTRPWVVADMPFLSVRSPDYAVEQAGRLMQEADAAMVKLEGGESQVDVARALADQGIPVCGHLGLQPQLFYKLGGFKVQGREAEAAQAIVDRAKALEQAGADMILLECVPNAVTQGVVEATSVPVIGIGAGPHAHGQILVMHDMLNVTTGRKPRFVKDFMAETGGVEAAFAAYVREVKSGAYPQPTHGFG
ncbi:MAG: 3-methyl-2-oxobutanoate hydroxymethyltransferase [Nevskiales bacterium]|nr:3-methyl-2-oxobutanoate hydroxymethyltransferase [Nevskiales bacterium]